MRKAIQLALVCGTLLFGLNAGAQQLNEADVPAAVKTKFASMHANTKGVNWEKENGKYEAAFKQNGVETSVLFDAKGAYFQTEMEIPVSSLPKAIGDYATKNFAARKIKEAAKITATDGTITYEAEIDDLDFIFDANGNFIKKETEDKDTEDKD